MISAPEKAGGASTPQPEPEVIHVTAQAIEALARYRFGCAAPPFVHACNGKPAVGAAIIEAEAVHADRLPTCPRCAVLWDAAVSGQAAELLRTPR